MKVIHILKRMETIDLDIKDLRKMEKSLARNKSFTTPIYMSIEKQINILLGERIKLLELQVKDPPPELVELIEGPAEERAPGKKQPKAPAQPAKKTKAKKTKAKSAPAKSASAKPARKSAAKKKPIDDIDIPILTQDTIDDKFENIKAKSKDTMILEKDTDDYDDDYFEDESVKLLDVALEKGTLNRTEIDKEKKKVKFFKDNFPSR